MVTGSGQGSLEGPFWVQKQTLPFVELYLLNGAAPLS